MSVSDETYNRLLNKYNSIRSGIRTQIGKSDELLEWLKIHKSYYNFDQNEKSIQLISKVSTALQYLLDAY